MCVINMTSLFLISDDLDQRKPVQLRLMAAGNVFIPQTKGNFWSSSDYLTQSSLYQQHLFIVYGDGL